MVRNTVFIITLLACFGAFAQFGKLKDKIKEKAGDVIKNEEVKEKLVEKSDEKVSEYDTSSFNYAIAFLDKSESFENKQKGESIIKATNFLLKSDTEKTDLEKARDLYEFGRINYTKRSYKLAEVYLTGAKVKYEELGETADPVYLKTLGLLGQLYSDMGRFEGAEEYTTQAMSGWENYFGSGTPGYAAEYNNMAVIQLKKGKYNVAEKQLLQARDQVEKTEGQSSVPYAITLNNLGILYVYMGRLKDAGELLERSTSIANEVLRDKSGTYLQLLTNKALVQQENGDYAAAEKTYKNALDLQTSRLKLNAKSDPDYAHMLNNLASLYVVTDRLDEAEKLLKESLEIYKNKFSGKHPLTASAQSDLGNLYRYSQKYEQADELLTKALEKRKELLGDDHPNTIQSTEDLAIVKWKTGKIKEAKELFEASITASLEFINNFFPPLSEVEKTQYWNQLKPRFFTYYNFAFENSSSDSSLLDKVIQYRVATKGLLLNTSTRIKNTILTSDNEELKRLYLQWTDQKRILASYYSLSKEEIAEQKINIDSLETAANRSERQLSELSSEFSAEFVSTRVNSGDLSSRLNENEALVEIIQYPVYKNRLSQTTGYAAIILKKGHAPKLILLDKEGLLDGKYFSVYKNLIRLKSKDTYSYKNFWKPVGDQLNEIQKVYFSPDGTYNQVNLNTLLLDNGSYLVESTTIRLLGNPNEILSIKKSGSNTRSAFLVGFPTYGSSDITPLPGTKEEVEAIRSYLSNAKYDIEFKTEGSATESAIKAARNPKILHIATHGFFLEDTQTGGGVFGVQINYASNNPLLRSGLMLAGASSKNERSSFSNDDNGVLTSYEALNLSLNDTDLVVLSACETGKGDIQSGEGVYGLQRAFTVAGAQQLIMSLWKVDDAATQKLMNNFYKNWITQGKDMEKSFRTAQLELMKEYDHPYYWGAFVLVN